VIELRAPYARLAGGFDFFSNCPADHSFETRTSDEFAQRVVDQRLIIAAAGIVHDFLKMLNQIIVEPNRYSSFSRTRGNGRTAAGFLEIVGSFHLADCLRFSLCMIVHQNIAV
jgi:hypothetical protein